MKFKIIKENFERAMNEQEAPNPIGGPFLGGPVVRKVGKKVADTIKGSEVGAKAKDYIQGLDKSGVPDQETMKAEMVEFYLAMYRAKITKELSQASPEQIEQVYREIQKMQKRGVTPEDIFGAGEQVLRNFARGLSDMLRQGFKASQVAR